MGLYSAVLFLRQIIVGSQTVRRRESQAAARNRKIIHDWIGEIAFPCNRHLAAVDGIGALVIKEVALAGEAAFPVKLPCHGAIISAFLLPGSLEGVASTATAGGEGENDGHAANTASILFHHIFALYM